MLKKTICLAILLLLDSINNAGATNPPEIISNDRDTNSQCPPPLTRQEQIKLRTRLIKARIIHSRLTNENQRLKARLEHFKSLKEVLEDLKRI